MKTRALVGLALAMLCATLVALGQPSAQAASAFTLRKARAVSIVGESNRIYGTVGPAKRLVVLYKLSRGRWVKMMSTRTGRGGAYQFHVKVTATQVVYRARAPRMRTQTGRLYGARGSNKLGIAGVNPSLYVGPPVVAGTATLAPAVATFFPARPGTVVRLYRATSAGPALAASAKQDSRGVAHFSGVSAGTSSAPLSYQAVALPGFGVRSVATAYAPSSFVTQSFDDEFTNALVSGTLWKLRPQDYTPQNGGRACSKPDATMTSVSGGYLTLKVKKLASSRAGATCPYGVWQNAMIGTGQATVPFNQSRGYFSARVRFQGAQGMHGSFWLQSRGGIGTEVDTAEYFGDGRALGGLATFVHQGTLVNASSAGSENATVKQVLGGASPSAGWHDYSVQWTSSGYLFRVDGVPVFQTSSYVSSEPNEMVLSLLTSDWELPMLKTPTSTMSVDWVRAYQ